MAEGVTTLEVKSGYGLTVEHECTQLQVARTLAQERTVDVVTTFLGAHALPPEAQGDADRYIDEVTLERGKRVTWRSGASNILLNSSANSA